MAKYVVEGSADINSEPDADGHPFRLLRDGAKVYGGCWADCVRVALALGRDADTLTSGTGAPYIDQPIPEARRDWDDDPDLPTETKGAT